MNQLDLKGRVAVITGGSQGIGLGVARRILCSEGAAAQWDTRFLFAGSSAGVPRDSPGHYAGKALRFAPHNFEL